ncbi:MAG: glutathione S-transferase family protein [Kiloniellaceae bacterium]
MLKLYDDPDSGNGYKVQLLLHFLETPYELVEVDSFAGGTRTQAFLEMNPNGKIPLLQLADGSLLPESNAILFYLAEGTAWLPGDRLGRAKALQWMFFEQYSLEPYIGVLRAWTRHSDRTPRTEPRWAVLEKAGYAALGVMEKQLTGRDWLLGDAAGGGPSIADIALYGYTHVADQGGFDLARYPAVRAWIGRFPGLPGFVPFAGRLKDSDDRKAG